MDILELPILEYLEDCWDPITADQLQELEAKLGFELPEDYKRFLRRYNGGGWRHRVEIMLPDATEEWDAIALGISIGIVPGDHQWYHDIWGSLGHLHYVPENSIPIIHSPGVGLLCLDCDPESYGEILYWENTVDEDDDYLYTCVASSFTELMHSLIRTKDSYLYFKDPLFAAIQRGDRRYLRDYLADGGDPEVLAEKGWTPLMWAGRLAWSRLVDQLLEAGADPQAIDSEGLTPMHHAIIGGSLDSVKRLLGARVDLNRRDESGRDWAQFAEERHAYRLRDFFRSLLD